MKYDFHVGDYVETVEGKKGYLSRHQVLSDGHIVFYVQYKDEKIYPCDVREDGLRYRFVRIGQYDFTETNNKIKPLPKEYNDLYSKINELVEAVNELRGKND